MNEHRITTTSKMDENGIDIDDWDMPIYRIFTTKWFEALITSRTNGLVTPRLWEDPYENFFLNNVIADNEGQHIGMESLANTWYGQCWTTNRDSDAMWRIYSPNKDGVRVQTTARKLLSSIYDTTDRFAALKYFIGTVKYLSKSNIEASLKNTTFSDLAMGGTTRGFARTLCTKRSEFGHEAEVRLLFHDTEKTKGINGVATFPFEPTKLLSEIALDPRLSAADYKTERTRLKAMGCTIPIIQSDLYHFTPITIRMS